MRKETLSRILKRRDGILIERLQLEKEMKLDPCQEKLWEEVSGGMGLDEK